MMEELPTISTPSEQPKPEIKKVVNKYIEEYEKLKSKIWKELKWKESKTEELNKVK